MQLTIIQQKIYEVRGQKVMLDFDLAELYEVETRTMNQAVKRNIDRFPADFMFRLTEEEWQCLRSQIVILDTGRGKYSKYLPFVFTEHGVTMLASVLKSQKAVQMNIAIVRAFIALRQYAMNYKELAEQINELRDKTGTHDAQLNQIYAAIENLLKDKAVQEDWKDHRQRIGYKS
jgi:phage regulator Rha-like protein